MGRNKKDATQDVLNLYNQMQEDENIESGKEEIKVTLKEIESAKKALYEAKEELGNAYRTSPPERWKRIRPPGSSYLPSTGCVPMRRDTSHPIPTIGTSPQRRTNRKCTASLQLCTHMPKTMMRKTHKLLPAN